MAIKQTEEHSTSTIKKMDIPLMKILQTKDEKENVSANMTQERKVELNTMQ